MLWDLDVTKVTFLIIGCYVAITAYLGIFLKDANFKVARQLANSLTSLGLIGTVAGIMMMLSSVGAATAHTDPTAIIGPMLHGYGTLLVTTMFGLGAALLLNLQMLFVFGSASDDEPID